MSKFIAVYDVYAYFNTHDAFDSTIGVFETETDVLDFISSESAEMGRDPIDYSIFVRHNVRQTLVMES